MKLNFHCSLQISVSVPTHFFFSFLMILSLHEIINFTDTHLLINLPVQRFLKIEFLHFYKLKGKTNFITALLIFISWIVLPFFFFLSYFEQRNRRKKNVHSRFKIVRLGSSLLPWWRLGCMCGSVFMLEGMNLV